MNQQQQKCVMYVPFFISLLFSINIIFLDNDGLLWTLFLVIEMCFWNLFYWDLMIVFFWFEFDDNKWKIEMYMYVYREREHLEEKRSVHTRSQCEFHSDWMKMKKSKWSNNRSVFIHEAVASLCVYMRFSSSSSSSFYFFFAWLLYYSIVL